MKGKTPYRLFLLTILLVSTPVYGQDPAISLGPWHLRSVSGALGLEGMYQLQNSQFNEFFEEQKSAYLIGGMKLNTSSYLWRPDIIDISLNGEYNPETRDEKYLVIPDRSEVRTLKKLELRTSFLNERNINLSSWMNLHQSYFNRENITNILSGNRQLGCLLNFNNAYLPFNIRFSSIQWDQNETETNRSFFMNQKNLQARLAKSFYGIDKHDLTYSFDDYAYTYADLRTITNRVNRTALNNQLFFDADKKYGFRSHVQYYDQQGTNTFQKLDANETATLHFPKNFDLITGWNFYKMNEPSQFIITNQGKMSLRHQLFKSMTSQVFTELSKTNHSVYTTGELKAGGDLNYTKKIAVGRINLGYSYLRHHNTTESEAGPIQIRNEPHSFSAIGEIILNKPYVDPISVTIYDAAGAILYEEGIDYYLNDINQFMEIVRIPGGLIPENSSVLISYTAIQPGTSHFEANNHRLYVGLSLFSKLLEIYYRGGWQEFRNVESAEFLTLNEYSQYVIGGKLDYNFISAGVELDLYQSSLVPYQRINYFLNLHGKITPRLLVSANGSLRDYMLLDTDVNHLYTNASGRISYQLTNSSKINFQASYLSQKGPNIDLELLTSRLEFITNFRKLYFTTGIHFYKRTYTNSNFTYSRAFVKLTRTF